MKSAKVLFILGLPIVLTTFLTAPARAAIQTETVEYKIGDTEFVGYLAYDDAGETPAPGVLVVHEWWGLNDYAKRRARDVAELGYVAFALDMYGGGKNTTDPQQAGQWAGQVRGDGDLARERFTAALRLLQEHERVDEDRIAAMGYCFGGGMVLNMARANLPLQGVASFHGGLENSWAWPPETITPKILVLHGAADSHIPDEELVEFMNEMREADANWQVNVYSDAKHAFTNPAADEAGMDSVAYDKQADERSWDALTLFFREILGPGRD